MERKFAKPIFLTSELVLRFYLLWLGEALVEEQRYILTHERVHAYPLDLKPDQVNILDIAHALGFQCRFNGHTEWLYSVAQHSYYVSLIVEELGGSPMDQLCGLLHDASETYLTDLPTPIKMQVSGYLEAEQRAMKVISEKFGLPEEFSPLVKRADIIMLATEARDLMGNPGWVLSESPIDWKIDRWKSHEPRAVFRMRFHYLMEQINPPAGERYWVDRIKPVSGRFDPRKKAANSKNFNCASRTTLGGK